MSLQPGDTFDTPAPPVDASIETPIPEKVTDVNDLNFDSFDNPLPIKAAPKTDEKSKKELETSQTGRIEKQEDKAEEIKKEEKDGEKAEEKEQVGEKEGEKTSGEKSKEVGEAPKGKTIKAEAGDLKLEIPEEATILVKVKGKTQAVSITELRDNYAGKTNWDAKFTEVDSARKQLEAEKSTLLADKQSLVDHLGHIVALADDTQKNPMEALHYLLDLAGRDVYSYTKRVFEAQQKEFEDYGLMDEIQRELHWERKKTKFLESQQESLASRQKEARDQQERIRTIDKLREAHGVSEDDFVQAHTDLVANGVEKPTPEQVVRYAEVLPFSKKAEEIVSPYFEKIGSEEDQEAVVTSVTKTLMNNPEFPIEEILNELKAMYGEESDEDIAQELAQKVTKPTSQVSSGTGYNPYRGQKSEDEIEMF